APGAEYESRRDRWRRRQARLDGRAALLRRAEKVIFGVIVIMGLLSQYESMRNKFIMIGTPSLLLQAASAGRKRCLRGSRLAGRAAEWYETRRACLRGEWGGRGPAGERFADEAHPCALDLDLFGRGSLFERMCLARTGAGEEALAAWLKAPADPDEV